MSSDRMSMLWPPVDIARVGNPICWDDAQGFSFENCCDQATHGAYGNDACFDIPFSFELCCLPDWQSRNERQACNWMEWMDKWNEAGNPMLSSTGEAISNPWIYQDSCCTSYKVDFGWCWSLVPELLELVPGTNISKGYATCCFDRLQDMTDLQADGAADPPWLAKELERETGDVTPFQTEDVDRVMMNDKEWPPGTGHGLCRIRRVDFQFHLAVEPERCLQTGRVMALYTVLQILNFRGLLPERVDLVVTSRDIELAYPGVPVFTDIRPASMGGGLLMRYPHEFLLGIWGRHMSNRVRRGVMSYPWSAKSEVLFWRGGMTGRWICPPDGSECSMLETFHGPRQWNISHWSLGLRGRAVLLGSFAPKGLVDIKFTSSAGMQSDVEALLRSRGWLDVDEGQQMLQDQFRAKYLLVTDDSDRAYWMATGNSLLFMPNSTMLRGCGLASMEPWVHYVPLQPDLSDAIERIFWAKAHDAEARLIAMRGAALAREAFSHEMQLYCLLRMVQQVSLITRL